MITPIKTMAINQIAERKDDLLMSSKDIKELARNERNKAIDEFAERLKEKAERESIGTHFPDGLYGEVVEVGELKNMIDKIAEEMRGAV